MQILQNILIRRTSLTPYDAQILGIVRRVEIDKSLLLPPGTKAQVGKSAVGKGDAEHHVFEKNLFPIYGRYGRGTRTILCSFKQHEQLHRILADCLAKGNFVDYELAIKSECPSIKEDVSKIYFDRIKSLKFGIIQRLAFVFKGLGTFPT